MANWRQQLVTAAMEARGKAYAPYSRISVGAALLSASGLITAGANIENASYSATVCAERVAFARALFAGEREFRAIAIVGGPAPAAAAEYFYPCGTCRQWMAEFCAPEFTVLVAKNMEDYQELRLAELLPHSFDPGHVR